MAIKLAKMAILGPNLKSDVPKTSVRAKLTQYIDLVWKNLMNTGTRKFIRELSTAFSSLRQTYRLNLRTKLVIFTLEITKLDLHIK